MKWEDANASGAFTAVTSLSASYKIPGTGAPGFGLAPVVRLTAVGDSPPAGAPGGFAVVNPVVGATYAFPLGGGFRAAAFLGTTIPVGMGGGDSPDAGLVTARNDGAFARAAMDGIDIAYVGHGFTVQAEATLFELVRVRGAAAQHEATKTNFTAGLHAGWFPLRMLSIGAEFRYQRWIDAPFKVEKDSTGDTWDNFTFAFGPRFHVPVGESSWLRPGVAFSRGIDKPMAGAMNADLVQVDVPYVF
jgi:hypothetical protein